MPFRFSGHHFVRFITIPIPLYYFPRLCTPFYYHHIHIIPTLFDICICSSTIISTLFSVHCAQSHYRHVQSHVARLYYTRYITHAQNVICMFHYLYYSNINQHITHSGISFSRLILIQFIQVYSILFTRRSIQVLYL